MNSDDVCVAFANLAAACTMLINACLYIIHTKDKRKNDEQWLKPKGGTTISCQVALFLMPASVAKICQSGVHMLSQQ